MLRDRESPSGRGFKLATLLALYFVQGLPFGFQAKALPIYLHEAGVSLVGIGFAGALSAPWMLKALWAPLVDRFGSRKAWIVPLQLALALTCAAAAFVPPETGLGVLLVLVFLMNLFAATQDIAVDGLAVDLLSDEELGPGNAAQVVGYKMGMLTSGGLLVYATADIGWTGLFAVMAALVAIVLLLVGFVREPPRSGTVRERVDLRAILDTLRRALAQPGGRWVLVVVATYKLGESLIDAMFKPFLLRQGFEAWQVGMWLGTWGMVFSIAGSIGGGLLARQLGIYRALVITATLRVLPLAAQTGLALFGAPEWAVVSATCAEHLFGGMLTTAMFAFMMASVDPRIGATHFTVLATIEVIGKSPGFWAAGGIATVFGFAPLFTLGTLISVAFLAALPKIRALTPASGKLP